MKSRTAAALVLLLLPGCSQASAIAATGRSSMHGSAQPAATAPSLAKIVDHCIGSNAMLSPADLGGSYDVIVQSAGGGLAFGFAGNADLVASLRDQRFVGYVADLAVHGPDRAEEDAYARSLNYQVGYWPLVPLYGTVVQHHPGLLEVYEHVAVFSNEAAASEMFGMLLKSESSQVQQFVNGTPVPTPTLLSQLTTSFLVYTPPRDAYSETTFGSNVVVGRAVLQVTFQGGSGLTADSVNSLTRVAAKELTYGC